MTKEEWEELRRLGMIGHKIRAEIDRETELIKKTEEEDEHPEEYDGPCMCRLCCSYGD
ncbi:MAG: hypothetical protein MUP27_08870 [Desulfobacterales bacterium]|nr:hypothetical protein [Desulfobacterales bacterium]